MECNLRRLDEPNLFERVVENFQLLNTQVPIDFDDDPFHAYARAWSGGRVDQWNPVWGTLKPEYVGVVTWSYHEAQEVNESSVIAW